MTRLESVCVYCGSSEHVAHRYLDAATELGRLIARAGLRLVYGGGGVGLMRRVADGAAREGGRVTGIIPAHLTSREAADRAPGETIVVDTMHERKRLMVERADGFAVLPGGYGTLDELFEILTWRQLGLHRKPIVLVDLDGYWGPLLALADRLAAEGFVTAAARRLLASVDDVGAVLPAIERALAPRGTLDGDLV